jgi:hypothetical protein
MQPPISSSDEARIAVLALDDRPPLASEALYHSRQAVEKALRASESPGSPGAS